MALVVSEPPEPGELRSTFQRLLNLGPTRGRATSAVAVWVPRLAQPSMSLRMTIRTLRPTASRQHMTRLIASTDKADRSNSDTPATVVHSQRNMLGGCPIRDPSRAHGAPLSDTTGLRE